jgi:hypothetical protein
VNANPIVCFANWTKMEDSPIVGVLPRHNSHVSLKEKKKVAKMMVMKTDDKRTYRNQNCLCNE